MSSRLASLRFQDAGHGYDRFGLSAPAVRLASRLGRLPYERYFRVDSVGAEHIPSSGAVILAANHGGMLPIDAAMLYLDLLRRTAPPRIPRMVADRFVPRLPFLWTAFCRTGAVSGSRASLHTLLDAGELLVVFPEGTPGIAKPFWHRYRLRPFRVGFAELAIRHRVPVVPVGLVGPDEQWLQIGHLDVHPFGAPYLPLSLNVVPLPVRYHIRYGAPLLLHDGLARGDADRPERIEAAAERVRREVAALIEGARRARKGLFR